MSGPSQYPSGYPQQQPPHGYPYPYPYPVPSPPPRRDNGRVVAIVLAILVVGGLGVAGYFGLQQAMKNYDVQRMAGGIAEQYAKAAKLYESGHYADAAAQFHQVREYPSSSAEMIQKAATGEAFCYRMLGQRAQEAGDLATAEGWFQKAVAAAPDDPGAQEELAAVHKAIAISQGTGNGYQGSGRTSLVPGTRSAVPGGSNPMPGFDPAKEPDEATQKAADAAEITERGKQLLTEGRNRDACREWHDAILKAPGSPGGIEAATLKQQYCPDVP